jgi:hypothetical protein
LLPVKGNSGLVAKIHARPYGSLKRVVVALCDKELLGKIFTQGERVLDLKNYRGFYEGNPVSEMEAVELLKMADNANIVGEKSVGIARKAFGTSPVKAKTIKKIPHLQYYKI